MKKSKRMIEIEKLIDQAIKTVRRAISRIKEKQREEVQADDRDRETY